MLNYIYRGGTAVVPGTYGEGRGITMTEDVRCSGVEAKIEDCVRDRAFKSTWMHSEDVGVKCTGRIAFVNFFLIRIFSGQSLLILILIF